MSDKPRGFPPKYVKLYTLVWPIDMDYIDRVQAEHKLKTRNDAVRHILQTAREAATNRS